jgi:hypothetical protein
LPLVGRPLLPYTHLALHPCRRHFAPAVGPAILILSHIPRRHLNETPRVSRASGVSLLQHRQCWPHRGSSRTSGRSWVCCSTAATSPRRLSKACARRVKRTRPMLRYVEKADPQALFALQADGLGWGCAVDSARWIERVGCERLPACVRTKDGACALFVYSVCCMCCAASSVGSVVGHGVTSELVCVVVSRWCAGA